MRALYGYLALHYLERKRPPPGRYTVYIPKAGLRDHVIKAEKLDASDPNTRWITLKPHGDESDAYVRVLVKINPDGTGNVMSGGEGLRGLKLTRLGTPEDYKTRAKEKQQKKRDEARKKRKEDEERAKKDPAYAKELEQRRAEEKAEKDRAAQERRALEQRLMEKRKQQSEIAQQLGLEGWDEIDPELITDPQAVKKRLGDTGGAGMVVGQQRRRVMQNLKTLERNLVKELAENQELRREVLEDDRAGVDPEESIAGKPRGGMGFKRDERAEAEARGMTPEETRRRSRQLAEDRIEAIRETEPERAGAIREARAKMQNMHAVAKALREEGAAGPKEIGREVDPVAVKERADAVREFLRLAEESKKLERDMREFSGDTAGIASAIQNRTPTAFDLDMEVANDAFLQKLRQDIKETAKLDVTKSFFEELDFEPHGLDYKASQKIMLGKVSHAAYAHLNGALLTALGESSLDRRVLDTIGVEGAAQLTAWKLSKSLDANTFQQLREGLKSYHDQESIRVMGEATQAAQRAKAAALETKLPLITDAESLVAAKELNAERQAHLEDAIGELSAALGQVEAGAALNFALRRPPRDAMTIRFGTQANNEKVIVGLAAMGLEEGDYQMQRTLDENELRVTLSESGMEKLTPSEPAEEIARRQKLEAIRRGELDEEDWLPAGFSRYPLNIHNDPEVAEPDAFAVPPGFKDGKPVAEAMTEFVASRLADGWKASDILRSMASTDFILKNVPQSQEKAFFESMNELFPAQKEDGSGRNVDTDEELQARYQELAQAYVAQAYPDQADFHTQSIDIDSENTRRAAYIAVANDPRLMSAYAHYDQLDNDDRRAVRGFYFQDIAGLDKSGVNRDAYQQALEELGPEPEKEAEGMFGTQINPEWSAWQGKRQEIAGRYANPAEWKDFVQAMGGTRKAYAAVQEVMRGEFNERFQRAYANLAGEQPFRTGLSGIPKGDALKQAANPEARKQMLAERRQQAAQVRERQGGRFAAEGEGAVIEKLQRQLEQERLMQQSSIGLFGDSPVQSETEVGKRQEVQDKLTERLSLGHRAEQQLASVLPMFKGGIKPITAGVNLIPEATMGAGTRFAPQQRAIKFAIEAGKSAQALGMGSGKTNISIGTFTELHSRGEARKALMVVPSAVRNQFGQEMATFTEPGQYKWHAEDSSFEDRLAAYKNPDMQMHVITHQTMRDDMVKIMARHVGEHMDEADVQESFMQRSPQERRSMLRQALNAEGLESLLDYMAVDEGHIMLNREGKPDSLMSAIGDAAMQEAKRGIYASGTPVKNDASEVYDVLRKLDPERWEGKENEFKRRYGADLPVAKEAFMREAKRYVYANTIRSGAPRRDVWGAEREDGSQAPLELSSAQQSRLQAVNTAFESVRQARREGRVDVDAMKTLSPDSFAGQGDDQHEEIAKNLGRSIGTLRFAAESRAIDTAPPQENAKVQRVLEMARAKREAGQPGVVFAHSLEAVRILKESLEADGHRVDTITGGDTSQEKGVKRTKFKPDTGEAETDILILSDAGAAGLNLQRGQWLVNYDIPLTHATWKQRNARIDRVGQQNAVEVHTLATDTRFDRDAMRRLERKGNLQGIFEENWEALDDTGLAKYIRMAQGPDEQRFARHFVMREAAD